jgi:hypothetical protein
MTLFAGACGGGSSGGGPQPVYAVGAPHLDSRGAASCCETTAVMTSRLAPTVRSHSQHSIDRSTGVLTELPGSPYAAGIAPSVTIDPLGRFLYVANAGSIHLGPGSGGVVAYPIDAASGAPVGATPPRAH